MNSQAASILNVACLGTTHRFRLLRLRIPPVPKGPTRVARGFRPGKTDQPPFQAPTGRGEMEHVLRHRPSGALRSAFAPKPEAEASGYSPSPLRGQNARLLNACLPIMVLFVLLLGVIGCGSRDAGNQRLLLFCGAGLKEPVAELAAEFQHDQDVTVECDYQGSETLLSRIKLLRRGDLYLPGDVSYVEQARDAGLIAKSQDVCYFVPVIIVSHESDHPPKSLIDLTRPGMRVGLGDAEACAIGRTSAKLMAKNNIPESKYGPNVVFRALTVNQLGDQVRLGHLDAAIVWDGVAAQFGDSVEVVEIPAEKNVISRVSLGILSCSQKPELADRFLQFVSSDRGREVFRKYGYCVTRPGETPPDGSP